MKQNRLLRISTVLSLAIFLVLLLLSERLYLRLDLSRDNAYSISDYSRNLVRDLPDQLSIDYYLSDRLVNRLPAVQEIQDLLYEYQRLGGGMVQLNIIDPEQDPEITPEELGISPRELQVVENNEQTFALVYSGIALAYRDRTEVIPLIADSATLEYELSSRILRLTRENPPSMAVLLGTTSQDWESYRTMLQYLGQYFDIQRLYPGDPIPVRVQGLTVLGSATLDEGDIYGIEQFILAGGSVFIGTESAEVDLSNNLQPLPVENPALGAMLRSMGISIGESWVFDSENLMLPFSQQQGRVIVNRYEPYPQWIRILGSTANSSHPLSSRFGGLDLFWASPLLVENPPEGIQVETLFTSSGQSVLVTDYNSDPQQASMLMMNPADASGSYPVGLSIHGSWSGSGAVSPEVLQERGISYPDVPAQNNDIRLVIMGDSDFPSELYQTGGSSYNILFMQGVFEYLLGDEQLLAIRTRGERNTRLDSLPSEEIKLLLIGFTRAMAFVILPVLLVGTALLRLYRRRRRALIPYGDMKSPAETGVSSGKGGSE